MRDMDMTKLDYRDFFPPNTVLCYGAGKMGEVMIPRMLHAGINIQNTMDRNAGEQTASIPCGTISVDDAIRRYGFNVTVIITIANEAVIVAVKDELAQKGFQKEKIYSYDIYNWLTVPSKRSYCTFLWHDIHYHMDGLRACCITNADNSSFLFEPFSAGKSFDYSLKSAIEKREWYCAQGSRGFVPLHCQGCPFLEEREVPEHLNITSIDFGSHSTCNLDCVYCEYGTSRQSAARPPYFEAKDEYRNFISLSERLIQLKLTPPIFDPFCGRRAFHRFKSP